MTSISQRPHEWLEYYRQFPYFSIDTVRDGCYPRIREQPKPATKAIVLVHGLTDSPYFMTAIGDYFFDVLGYNIYLPLLQCHGLKHPQDMQGVKLEQWLANVSFAVDIAASKADQVAIGGLSTGGTLSFYTAVNNPKITGRLYLFSAALDLAGPQGDLEEILLRTFLVDILEHLDDTQPLIGKHPYRYARTDMNAARELARLIQKTDRLIQGYRQTPLAKAIFAAHSEADVTANISGIEALQRVTVADQFDFFRIPKAAGVAHPSVVLKEPIYASDASASDFPLEYANPVFQAMVRAMGALA